MQSEISWILVFLEGTGAAQNARARLLSVAAAAGEGQLALSRAQSYFKIISLPPGFERL